MWWWILLAFVGGLAVGVLISLVGEQLSQIVEMGDPEDWWI